MGGKEGGGLATNRLKKFDPSGLWNSLKGGKEKYEGEHFD